VTRPDRSRNHATPSARARRIREAERRAAERREQGVEPYDRDRIRSWRLDETGEVALPRQRRGPSPRRVLLIGLLLVLLVTVIGGVLLYQRVSAFNDSVSTAPTLSSSLFGPLGGDERVNVVLFGYGGPEHKGGNYLSDSIQILSIDPATESTSMIPIPRDLWVEGLQQMPNNGKINEAFAIGYQEGGIERAATFASEVLSEITGLEISHWMAMDFTGFKEMVDAVGGVTVRNPTAFYYTWSEENFHAQHWSGGYFEEGPLDLDGTRALDYSRTRYTSVPAESSDFARSVRQQRVLSALRTKLGSGGLGSIGPGLAMMDALDGQMKTDLSAFDLFLLSSHLNPDRRIELKEDVILQATANTIGQYILVVIGRADATDYSPLQAYLAAELAKPIPSASPSPSAS
jgi:LCP family protein required for cell wall assembly